MCWLLPQLPITFETNEDLCWSRNDKGRICVHFNGLSEHIFKVYCDQRQLHWFKQFLDDQQTKRDSKNQHSSSLFVQHSARLAWQRGEGKGEPWNVNRLTLYCTIDTRLRTLKGTEQVRQEKAVEIVKITERLQEKDHLSKTQQQYLKRLNSTQATGTTAHSTPAPQGTKTRGIQSIW